MGRQRAAAVEIYPRNLDRVVAGLRDGTVSADGLDTFRLGYEFVRDTLQLHREALTRRAGRDENVVVVAKAVS